MITIYAANMQDFSLAARPGYEPVSESALVADRKAVLVVIAPDVTTALDFQQAFAHRLHAADFGGQWGVATLLPRGNVGLIYWEVAEQSGMTNDVLRQPGLHVLDLRANSQPGHRPFGEEGRTSESGLSEAIEKFAE